MAAMGYRCALVPGGEPCPPRRYMSPNNSGGFRVRSTNNHNHFAPAASERKRLNMADASKLRDKRLPAFHSDCLFLRCWVYPSHHSQRRAPSNA